MQQVFELSGVQPPHRSRRMSSNAFNLRRARRAIERSPDQVDQVGVSANVGIAISALGSLASMRVPLASPNQLS